MSYLLFITSGDHVQLYPEWSFDRDDENIQTRHKTRSGKQYVYKWGAISKWKMPLSYLNSHDASYINSWWRTNAELKLIDEDNPTQVYSVMIFGDKLPMGTYVKPYTSLYKGTIELATY